MWPAELTEKLTINEKIKIENKIDMSICTKEDCNSEIFCEAPKNLRDTFLFSAHFHGRKSADKNV